MGIVAAGLAVAAAGAGVSAYGAHKNAKSIQSAAQANAYGEEELFKRQTKELNKLVKQKENKLYNLGNIFDRFESTGAFGDTETLKNLRQAQSDFSELAAGDFTAFDAQLKKSMSDALVSTVGSGSPIGAYAGLAADTQMQYRTQGLQTAIGITDFLSNESMKLLGTEFGIMDQRYQNQYNLDRSKTTNIANFNSQKAAQEGVGMVAGGNALAQVGGMMSSYGLYNQGLDFQKQQLNIANQQATSMGSRSNRASQSVYPSGNFSIPNIPEPIMPDLNNTTVGSIPSAYDLPSYGSPNYTNPIAEAGRTNDGLKAFLYGYNFNSNNDMVLPSKQSSIMSSLGASIVSGR